MENHLGFLLNSRSLINNTYIPKFYNPEIASRLSELSDTHELITINSLIADGYAEISTGDEVGKMAYGTGTIPFIRTSDISNWELKTDAKQGVSQEIYDVYTKKQDVREGDIFIVKDGTYLIGQSCVVSKGDLPLLYQSHIFKLRIKNNSPYDPFLIFAAINTPIFKLQIRSVQFTADIIDTVGNRILDLKIPIPKDKKTSNRLADEVIEHVKTRTLLKNNIKTLPLSAQGKVSDTEEEAFEQGLFTPSVTTAFKTNASSLKANIYIPKYYDPLLEKDLNELSHSHDLVSLGQMVTDDILEWSTGIEVGKMAYGTGTIPFIRTSDISNWELKTDAKQGVSEEIYTNNIQDVQAEDIFIVRDGTYLVGSSCIVTSSDTKVLYCGGLYKLRVLQKDIINPYLLLTLFNTPIVRRQMRSKQFTRDIIDTLGKRLFEVMIPIPKDKEKCKEVTTITLDTITERVRLRERARNIILELEGELAPEELSVIENEL